MLSFLNKRVIVLIMIVTTIIFGEIVARFFLGLGTPPLSITHPSIEYMYKPNQEVQRFGNLMFINKYGMRSENFSKKKADNEFRILVFGDSVLNGGNLTDQKNLATSILQDELQSFSDKNIVVGNVSAGSWGPGNWLAYFQKYGFFDTDMVILVISSHDYVDNPTYQVLNKNTHPTETPISALAEGFTRYLPRYLPAVNSKKEKIKKYRYEEMVDQKDKEQGLADLKSFLTSAKRNSPDVYVFQYLEEPEITTQKTFPGYKEIKKLCESLNVEVFSFEPYFQNAIMKKENPYRDDIHPNEVGQRAMANTLLDFFKLNQSRLGML